jgi:hypothetical protein
MIRRGGKPVQGFSLGSIQSEVADSFCLPSGDAALRLMRGESGAWLDVGGTMLARGALMATGLAVAGFRGKQLVKGTVAAGLAVEAFVLGWAAWKNREKS